MSDPDSAHPTTLGPVGSMHQELLVLRAQLDALETRVRAIESLMPAPAMR